MDYPSNMPVAEMANVVRIAKSNAFVTERKAFAHDGWVVQGYLQSMVIGRPVEQFVSQSAVDPVEVMDKLSNGNEMSAQALIPWEALLIWLGEKLVTYVIDHYKSPVGQNG